LKCLKLLFDLIMETFGFEFDFLLNDLIS
jgi:hypothetical protein